MVFTRWLDTLWPAWLLQQLDFLLGEVEPFCVPILILDQVLPLTGIMLTDDAFVPLLVIDPENLAAEAHNLLSMPVS